MEVLKFLLCRVRKVTITVAQQVREQPHADTEMVFLPYYVRPTDRPLAATWQGFLTKANRLAPQPIGRSSHAVQHIHQSFVGDGYTLFRQFRVSQWPGVADDLRTDIGEAFEVFLKYLQSGASVMGR
jgi:hypothetical protein